MPTPTCLGSTLVEPPFDLFCGVSLLAAVGAPMLYIENLEQGKAEWFELDDSSDEPPVGDPLRLFPSSVFFGLVTLDANGDPSRLKLTMTQSAPAIDASGNQDGMCIVYHKFTSMGMVEE